MIIKRWENAKVFYQSHRLIFEHVYLRGRSVRSGGF
ncbi:MAG: hypothetical protein ACD_78C00149G0001, partial [uncultured bacterium (gcode 4)]